MASERAKKYYRGLRAGVHPEPRRLLNALPMAGPLDRAGRRNPRMLSMFQAEQRELEQQARSEQAAQVNRGSILPR